VIDPFPEEYELLAFFGTEPVVSELEAGWAYSDVTFTLGEGDEEFVFTVNRAYEHVTLRWSDSHGNRRLLLRFSGVASLEIDHPAARKTLIVRSAAEDVADMLLTVQPHVQVTWGTEVVA